MDIICAWCKKKYGHKDGNGESHGICTVCEELFFLKEDKIMSEITKIRIGFSTSKTSWISKIIRWFTKGRSSHCFFVYYDVDFERDMVMEATEGGFKITPFSKYENSIVAIFEPKQSIDVGLKKAVDWLEEEYDYAGLIGMIWVEIGRWLKRKWYNPLHTSNTMFCSEAVVRILQWSAYPGSDQFEPCSTDPQMLLEFCRANMTQE